MPQLKKIFYHPVLIVATTILVFVAIFSLQQRLQRLSLSQENLKSAQKSFENQKMITQQDQDTLEEKKQPLSQEKLIRDELLGQTENEIAIKLPDIILEQEEPEQVPEKSIYEQWLEVLGVANN